MKKLATEAQNAAPAPAQRPALQLNYNCPTGLFQGRTGNRYIVVEDSDFLVAIVLRHQLLSTFTWLTLHEHPLDEGRSIEKCWLRPTHLSIGDHGEGEPLLLGIEGRAATLLCNSPAGGCNWLPLGSLRKRCCIGGDFDGWSVEVEQMRAPFFEQVPISGNRGGRLRLRA